GLQGRQPARQEYDGQDGDNLKEEAIKRHLPRRHGLFGGEIFGDCVHDWQRQYAQHHDDDAGDILAAVLQTIGSARVHPVTPQSWATVSPAGVVLTHAKSRPVIALQSLPDAMRRLGRNTASTPSNG